MVIWALCFYGRNRLCCPCCAKRKDNDWDDKPSFLKKGRKNKRDSAASDDVLMRELSAQQLGFNHAAGQGARPLAATREDSGLTSIVEGERAGRVLSAGRISSAGKASSLRGFV